jgi:uncharacterized membrane protein YcaP (DUF421 family)
VSLKVFFSAASTVIIIALGAAGDPMFYEEVGIIPPITVFLHHTFVPISHLVHREK